MKKRRNSQKIATYRSKRPRSLQKGQRLKNRSKKSKLANNPILSAKKVCYILLVTTVVLIILFHKSIKVFLEQTYHTDIRIGRSLPIMKLDSSHEELLSVDEPVESIKQEQLATTTKQVIDNQDSRQKTVTTKQQEKPIKQSVITKDKKLNQIERSDVNFESLDDYQNSNPKTSTERVNLKNSDKTQSSEIQSPLVLTVPKPIILTGIDKVLFAGDSLMQGVAPFVQKMLFKQYKIESINLSKQSTGLTYPSAFDWPKTINDKLDEVAAIKLLVIFLGPNDPWDFPVKKLGNKFVKFKSAPWEDEYRARIEAILTSAQEHQVQVLWLSPPCMRKTKLNEGIIYLNSLYQSEVNKVEQHFLMTNALLGCSYDKYNNYVTTDKDAIKVRADDGIHFTVDGQKILAKAIMEQITVNQIEDSNRD